MSPTRKFKVVIDTNVVFEGLTKQGGAAGLIIDAWLAGFINVCVSNALGYEYEDVLSRKLSDARCGSACNLFWEYCLTLLSL